MGLFRNAKETADEIRDAAGRVGEAAELQTVALVCVCMVSVAALGVAMIALLSAEEQTG